jgi:hypothetical protein
MILTDMTGLVGIAFAVAVLLVRLLGAKYLSRVTGFLLVGILMVTALLSVIQGLSLAGYLRGYVGDLSITTWVVLSIILFGKGRSLVSQRHDLLVLIALTALIFYPLALGLGLFDPYRLGFGHIGFMVSLLLLSLWCVYQQKNLIVWSICLALFAWTVGWSESNNMWDYLIDPWLSVYAVGAMIRHLWCKVVSRKMPVRHV